MASVVSPEVLSKLIVALDYEDPSQAFGLVDTLGDQVQWYKVGPMLFTQSGAEVITYLRKKNKRVFLDLKLHDTPNVVSNTIKQVGALGVDFMTVHLMGGMEMLHAASESCRGSKLRLLGVSLLTSQGANELNRWGWKASEEEIVLKLLDVALESRLAGILCSPQEIERVRPKTLPGFLIFSAGIRMKGQEVFQDDQKRVATASAALNAGADYIIVGRPITQSPEPLNVVKRLFD